MKTIFSFTFFIAVIAASAQWVDITPDTAWSYGNHSFPTANDGFAIREATNVIYKTTDAGATWSTVSVDSTNLTDIHFVSPLVGFVTGNAVFPGSLYNVAKTIDGGNTWTPIAPTSAAYNSVYFKDALEGYVSGNYGNLFKTTDGGSSWSPVISSNSEMADKSFSPTSDTSHFAGWDGTFGYRGAIQSTVDGGVTWTETVLGKWYTSIQAIHMLNGISGVFALGQWGSPNGTHFYTTNDGFATLDSVLKPTMNIYDVFYESSTAGYLAADSGRIYKTTDGINFSIDHNHGVQYNFKRITKTANTLYAAGVRVILKNNLGTGMKDRYVDSKDFIFYPNPADQLTNIEVLEAATVTITDLQGKVVYAQDVPKGKSQINVASLSPGVYTIRGAGQARKLLIH